LLDKSSVLLLFHLFNVIFTLNIKIDQLVEWSALFNGAKVKIKITLLKVITEPVKLTFNNSWLCFVDMKVVANVYISKNNRGISLRFIVDQQYGLSAFSQLKTILGSSSIYALKILLQICCN